MCFKHAVMDCGASTHATPTLLKVGLFMKEKDDFYRFYWGAHGISIREDITQYFKKENEEATLQDIFLGLNIHNFAYLAIS